MSTTAQNIVDTAKRFLGCNARNNTHKVIIDEYNKISPLPRGYKLQYTDPWCAGYVSAIAHMCNATDIIPCECSCGKMLSLCSKMGIFVENDAYIPVMGDIIFFDWDDSGKGDCVGYPDHVGYVLSTGLVNFQTIEGNKDKAVGIRTLPFNSRYIRGWARPRYAEAIMNPPAPDNSSLSLDQLDVIARAVIRGHYGNGAERVSRLTSAGFDAKAVQARVNELLRVR